MSRSVAARRSRSVPSAAGQASRFAQLEAAYAQSPDVTRRRLYMDSVEKVLSRAHTVLIDARAGGSMFYLPIDKLLEKGAAREAEPGTEAPAGGTAKEAVPPMQSASPAPAAPAPADAPAPRQPEMVPIAPLE